MDFGDDDIESIMYICREVNVYKIPPLKTNEGHRAQEWGDLAAPLWKGRLRITENSKGAALLFEDSSTGELFARAEYPISKPSVEAVLDSSRYFVIRVENAGRKAYIGMGFAERSDSFDFNVALQDYTKRAKAALNPPTPTESTPSAPAAAKKDYSLKEGQTFSISIPGRNKDNRSPANFTASTAAPPANQSTDLFGGDFDLLGGSSTTSTPANTSSSSSGGFPILAPPPSGGSGFKLPPPPSAKH